MRRDYILQDLLRVTTKRGFHPHMKIETWFVGEAGEDTGGLTRELWCLFSKSIQRQLCEGQENCLVFRHDTGKLQVSII